MKDPDQFIDPKPAKKLWTTINDLINGFFDQLPMFGLALVVLIVAWIVSGLVAKGVDRMFKNRGNKDLGRVLSSLLKILIIVGGVLGAVTIAAPSVKPADLLGALGFGGVAIGFAFRDILQNLLAGILILIREPFSVGDQIIYKEFEGTVDRIETRATIVITYDGRRAVIPNGEIYTNAIVVNTAKEKRRSQYDIGIGYGDSIEEAKKVMAEAMNGLEGVLDEPKPEVLTVALADSYVSLRARWWSLPERGEVIWTHERVLTAIKVALDKAGIDMPYPTQVHLFHDQTEATDGDRTRQREGWTPRGDDPKSARLSMALSSEGKAEQDDRKDMGKDQNADLV